MRLIVTAWSHGGSNPPRATPTARCRNWYTAGLCQGFEKLSQSCRFLPASNRRSSRCLDERPQCREAPVRIRAGLPMCGMGIRGSTPRPRFLGPWCSVSTLDFNLTVTNRRQRESVTTVHSTFRAGQVRLHPVRLVLPLPSARGSHWPRRRRYPTIECAIGGCGFESHGRLTPTPTRRQGAALRRPPKAGTCIRVGGPADECGETPGPGGPRVGSGFGQSVSCGWEARSTRCGGVSATGPRSRCPVGQGPRCRGRTLR